MNAKEHLLNYQVLKKRKARAMRALRDVYEDVGGTSGVDYSRDVVKTSPTNDMMIRTLEDIEKRAGMLEAEIKGCRDAMYAVEDEVRGLDKALYIDILWLRYIEDMRLYDVSLTLGLSYPHIKREHGHALQYFAKKYENDTF